MRERVVRRSGSVQHPSAESSTETTAGGTVTALSPPVGVPVDTPVDATPTAAVDPEEIVLRNDGPHALRAAWPVLFGLGVLHV